MAEFPQPTLPPGIPGYHLYRPIGAGAYGEVWLATDDVGRWWAVKITFPPRGGGEQSASREFRAIERYAPIGDQHANLVRIIAPAWLPHTGQFYYSMELADDATTKAPLPRCSTPEERAAVAAYYHPRTLRSELQRRSRFSPAECVECGLPLAMALGQLHSRGVIHRDIKPENIIYVAGQPKLADLGLVAEAGGQHSIAGTTAYLAPEPKRREPADIFALGVVLYELATGQPAERCPQVPAGIAQLGNMELSEWNELNAVILKACHPNPGLRHAGADELREELELLRNQGSVRQRRAQESFRRQLLDQRKNLLLAASAIILLVLAWSQWRQARLNERYAKLREIELEQFKPHYSTWSTNDLARLEVLGGGIADRAVLGRFVAALADWDAETRPVLTNEGVSIAFHPDGRALVGGITNRVCLLATNKPVSEFAASGPGVVAWDGDQPLQLTVLGNDLVLREADTTRIRRRFALPESLATNWYQSPVLAMAADQSWVAAAGAKHLLVWRVGDNQSLRELPTQATCLAFNEDNSRLAAGMADGVTRVYSIPDFNAPSNLVPATRAGAVECLAFCRDRLVRFDKIGAQPNWLLATGGRGAELIVWDLASCLQRMRAQGSWVITGLVFSPDGQLVISFGGDEPTVWDAATGAQVLHLRKNDPGKHTSLAFAPKGGYLLAGGPRANRPAVVNRFDLTQERGIRSLRGLVGKARLVWFSPDSLRVAALTDHCQLGFWDVRTGRLLQVFETPPGPFADTAGGCFDASGEHFNLAIGTNVVQFGVDTGGINRRWRVEKGEANQMAYDAAGRLLLLRGEEDIDHGMGTWRLYELKDDVQPKWTHEAGWTNQLPVALALPYGAKYFLVWDWSEDNPNRSVAVYDTATAKLLTNFPSDVRGWGLPVKVSSDGATIFIPSSHLGESRLVHFPDFAERRTPMDGLQAIGVEMHQSVHPGGIYLGASPAERDIPIPGNWGAVLTSAAFSLDGTNVAMPTLSGAVELINLPSLRTNLSNFNEVRRSLRTEFRVW